MFPFTTSEQRSLTLYVQSTSPVPMRATLAIKFDAVCEPDH